MSAEQNSVLRIMIPTLRQSRSTKKKKYNAVNIE